MHQITIAVAVSLAIILPASAQKKQVSFPPNTKDGARVGTITTKSAKPPAGTTTTSSKPK